MILLPSSLEPPNHPTSKPQPQTYAPYELPYLLGGVRDVNGRVGVGRAHLSTVALEAGEKLALDQRGLIGGSTPHPPPRRRHRSRVHITYPRLNLTLTAFSTGKESRSYGRRLPERTCLPWPSPSRVFSGLAFHTVAAAPELLGRNWRETMTTYLVPTDARRGVARHAKVWVLVDGTWDKASQLLALAEHVREAVRERGGRLSRIV
jgi:hypothetical protein